MLFFPNLKFFGVTGHFRPFIGQISIRHCRRLNYPNSKISKSPKRRGGQTFLLMCQITSVHPKLCGYRPLENFWALEGQMSKTSKSKDMFWLQMWILRKNLRRLVRAYSLCAPKYFKTPFPQEMPYIYGGKRGQKKFRTKRSHATSILRKFSRKIQIFSENMPLLLEIFDFWTSKVQNFHGSRAKILPNTNKPLSRAI